VSTIKHRGKMYRRLDDDAPAQKGDLYVAKEMSYYREVQHEAKPDGKTYRRLEVGEVIQEGDLAKVQGRLDMTTAFETCAAGEEVEEDDFCSYYREVQPEAKPETPAPIEDGGPAFPLQDWDECIHSRRTETGMTLRDWFAGQALVALPHIGCGADLTPTELALSAYQMADAMLKARKEVQHG
jgi:hypothetical protein